MRSGSRSRRFEWLPSLADDRRITALMATGGFETRSALMREALVVLERVTTNEGRRGEHPDGLDNHGIGARDDSSFYAAP